MKRPVGGGSGSSSTNPARIVSSSPEASRAGSSPAASASTRSSKRGPATAASSSSRTGLGGQTREALPHELADPLGASQLGQRPGQAQAAVGLLDRAALAQVTPELAEQAAASRR